jgi:hypothetical protein
LSFPRKWVEDSTRRESSLCSQGLDPRFRGDDTSVDFSHSLHPFGICARRTFGIIQKSQFVNGKLTGGRVLAQFVIPAKAGRRLPTGL